MSGNQTIFPSRGKRQSVTVDRLSETARVLFPRVLREFSDRRIPCALAGGFATHFYSGGWQDTADLDLLILPQDRDLAVQVLHQCQLGDMFPQKPYDVNWIYRGTREETVVDLIWQAANYHSLTNGQVTSDWFSRSVTTTFLGESMRVVDAADLCWLKMYVLERRRCDWPDIFNIIIGTGGELDWAQWTSMCGDDVGVLRAIVALFDATFPEYYDLIPDQARLALTVSVRCPEKNCPSKLFGPQWTTHVGAGFVRSRDGT